MLLSNSPEIVTPKVIGRIKERNECLDKFNLKYRKDLEKSKQDYEIKDYISDLIGLRVICHYESDIKKIVEILKGNFELIELTDKTSQLLEQKGFGYKGIHMDLKLNNDRKKLSEYSRISKLQFEVQIRSIVQDAWSEVDHKLKYKKSLSDDLQRKIVVLASLFELADREFDSIRVAAINEFEERIVAEQNQHKAVINVFNLLSFLKV